MYIVLVGSSSSRLGIGLIFLVLIHSGRGGGLSDMFGGGLARRRPGSTVMEKNLDRITVVIALLFAFNTLILGFLIDQVAQPPPAAYPSTPSSRTGACHSR